MVRKKEKKKKKIMRKGEKLNLNKGRANKSLPALSLTGGREGARSFFIFVLPL
jgi:hypothetical protein